MIWVTGSGLIGRFLFAFLSERIGRRTSAAIVGLGAAAATVAAGYYSTATVATMFGPISLFWLFLMCIQILSSGGWSVIGPYAAEVWPSHLRATGLGSAYGFGGIGKVIGPAGLALIIGSDNLVNPKVTLDALFHAFLYLAAWFAAAGLIYACFGFETKGRTFADVDAQLAAGQPAAGARKPGTAAAS